MQKFVIEKPFLFMMILAIVAATGFFGFWYYRDQIFTTEVLRVGINGPENASMGEEINYKVTYKNNGNFTLESPRLVFELPEHSLNEGGKLRFTQQLQDIKPGHQDFVTFPARLLGKEGDIKTAHAWISYVPHNLSVRYETEATSETKINSVPIDLDYDVPANFDRGKEITYSVNYFSNVDYPLENLSLKLDPVTGFKITSTTPSSLNNAEWRLPVLEKSKGGKVTVTGTAMADSPDQLQFSAHLGMWLDGNFIVLKEASKTASVSGVAVVEPPKPVKPPDTHVAVSQKGYYKGSQDFENSGPVPPQVGVPTTYTITWRVGSDVNEVKNAKVTATLPANATLSAVLPESQLPYFSLDGVTKKITWTVPKIPAKSIGAGPSISFQVAVTPASSQQGNFANIIGAATLVGQDEVTGSTVSARDSAINTDLPDDAANSGGGIVK
ncbi:hypothetical protein KW786_00640 [Candidatus Parcubacteria bacterium]|nr:hypothetical protein [Candidatus Parcubacteria bacterium]